MDVEDLVLFFKLQCNYDSPIVLSIDFLAPLKSRPESFTPQYGHPQNVLLDCPFGLSTRDYKYQKRQKYTKIQEFSQSKHTHSSRISSSSFRVPSSVGRRTIPTCASPIEIACEYGRTVGERLGDGDAEVSSEREEVFPKRNSFFRKVLNLLDFLSSSLSSARGDLEKRKNLVSLEKRFIAAR